MPYSTLGYDSEFLIYHNVLHVTTPNPLSSPDRSRCRTKGPALPLAAIISHEPFRSRASPPARVVSFHPSGRRRDNHTRRYDVYVRNSRTRDSDAAGVARILDTRRDGWTSAT